MSTHFQQYDQHHTCLTVSQYQTTQELVKKASVGLWILIHICEYLLRLADSAKMSHWKKTGQNYHSLPYLDIFIK